MMKTRAVRKREDGIGRSLRAHGVSMDGLHRNPNLAQEQELPTHHSGIVAATDPRMQILIEPVIDLIRGPHTLHYLLEIPTSRNNKGVRILETEMLIGRGNRNLEGDTMAGSESHILPAEALSQNMEPRTLPTGSDNHTPRTGSLRDDNEVQILQMGIPSEALQSDMDLTQMLLNLPVPSQWAGAKAILSGNPTKILQLAVHDR